MSETPENNDQNAKEPITEKIPVAELTPGQAKFMFELAGKINAGEIPSFAYGEEYLTCEGGKNTSVVDLVNTKSASIDLTES